MFWLMATTNHVRPYASASGYLRWPNGLVIDFKLALRDSKTLKSFGDRRCSAVK